MPKVRNRAQSTVLLRNRRLGAVAQLLLDLLQSLPVRPAVATGMSE